MIFESIELNQVFGILNKDEMLVLVWIRKIASAKIGAKESLIILAMFYSPSLGGIEFVTITWSSWEFWIF